VIDLPQLVEVVSNPTGLDFLHRDCVNVCTWFTRQGVEADPEEIFGDLVARMF
jgi:RIO kinase 1